MSLLPGMSVRGKAVLAAAGTVGVALAVCMLALVLALQHNLRDSARADAQKTAADVRVQLAAGKTHVSDTVAAAPENVTIRDSEGRIIRPAPLDAAKAPEDDSSTPGDTTVNGTHATARAATGYTVDVAPSNTALDNATGFLLRVVAPAAAGLVLFVAALTWLLVGRALRPVAAIRQEVTEITERDLHRRVPVPRARDEISRLARTMNATLDRLQRAMTQQRQFVADASHELRSPIAAVRAQLELALARPSRTDWPTAVHKALQDTERLQAVAADLLLLARLDADEAPPTSPVDLAALTTEEARRHPGTLLAPDGDGAGDGAGAGDGTGEGAGEGAGDGTVAAVVTGSRVQLSRLLTNLTDNARRHAHHTVSLTVKADEHSVEMTVDDDGPGIPEPDRERVFERFTRLDRARARHDGGTGLGLAIAREIAHAHRGTLTAHPSPLGGARMLLRLPRHRDTGMESKPAGPSAVSRPPSAVRRA
ncbi:sensor histidine kinase [Streptomyces sp. NPDC054765]